jgi:hypothetical protein
MTTRKQRAIKVWKDGEAWLELRDECGAFVATVATAQEATAYAEDIVFIETEEPRFLVRDEGGRGWCAERAYTEFTQEEREYREEGTDTDYAGNEIEFESFGEWLDSSNAGDEFDNGDDNYTVIRIN